MAVVVDVLIVVTGGAVRLTGSGLGCPTWPRCTATSLLPETSEHHSAINVAIEFGNRQITWIVGAVAIACAILALRQAPRRRDLVRLGFGMVGMVVLQAVVGGVSVLYELDWGWIAIHFLLSMVLLWIAVGFYVRSREGDDPPRLLVRRELAVVMWALVAVTGATLVAGTIVTATGPHAGDPGTSRLDLNPRDVTQLHADLVFLLIGLTVALWFALKAFDAAPSMRKAVAVLFAAEMAQGVIGYVQYFTHVPAVLVGFHMFGACVVWIAALMVAFRSRERGPLAVPPPEIHAAGVEDESLRITA